MKAWLRGSAVSKLAAHARAAYREEVSRLEKADKHSERELAALTSRLTQAWEQLTVTLMPGLVPEHLDWCAHLLRLPALSAEATKSRLWRERCELEDERAAIDANPVYVDREARLNECSIQISEYQRIIEPLRASTSLKKNTPYFEELILYKYDTPDYWYDFWELAYYRHWKHGDLIVEEFGEPHGLTRFREVQQRYEEELRALATLEEELAEWQAKEAELQAIIARRAEIESSLASLEDRQWAQSRARIFQHLRDLGGKDLLALISSYEPALYIAKRVSGIQAKIDYLREIRAKWVLTPLAHAERKMEKAARGVVKFQRSKNYHRSFDREQMERKYAVPAESWAKRWHRFDAVVPRLLDYDGYDEYDGSTIWWHHMTGGSVKARFIPEVRDYYAEQRAAKMAEREGSAQERAIAALAGEAASEVDVEADWDDMS